MSKFGIAMLAATATLMIATPAPAKTIYDGNWSVVIITEAGTCDRAYRYAIDIKDGVVRYRGDVVEMSGRVSPKGTVRVTVSRNGQSASGVGRMSRNFGRGTWSGSAAGSSCSGRWEAERR